MFFFFFSFLSASLLPVMCGFTLMWNAFSTETTHGLNAARKVLQVERAHIFRVRAAR
jgi:hypothetical protein